MLVRKKVLLVFLVLTVSVMLYTLLYFHMNSAMGNTSREFFSFSKLSQISNSFSVARRTLAIDKVLSTSSTPINQNHEKESQEDHEKENYEKLSQETKSKSSTQSSSVTSSPTGGPSSANTQEDQRVTDEVTIEEDLGSSSEDLNFETEVPFIEGSQAIPSTNKPRTESHMTSESENATTREPGTVTALPKRENWQNDSFCYDFLENTFQKFLRVCSNEPVQNNSVKCYGSPHSENMATCTIENVAIKLSVFAKAMHHPDYVSFKSDDSLTLINDRPQICIRPTASKLRARVETGDYVLKMVEKLADTNQVASNVCEKWVNETVYFYTAHPRHIYFHFLDLYNLHKLVSMHNQSSGEYKIIRISTSDDYSFEKFDKLVFPGITHIGALPDVRTCFRKVILVPKSYASVLFQCKMHWMLKKDCINCDGMGLVGTSFNSFRSRVVRACSLDDSLPRKNSSLVLISRTPYTRDPEDSPEKFERLLSNEDQLVASLRKKYPNANISTVHFENFSVCEQVRLANEANVLLGVHGAGLVHLWWLRDDALAFEMEPYFEVGNPSFRVLSKITGRHYHSDYIGGGWQRVNAEIPDVLKALSDHATVP